jgi:flagellar motor switch protein FliM
MANTANERGAAAPWLQEGNADPVGFSIEKMPLLESALDQFAVIAGARLAPICGVGVTATVDGIEATTTFELLAVYQHHLAAMLHCASLEARMLLILDPRIVDFVLRAVFDAGPRREEATSEPNAEDRPRSEVESCLVAEFAKTLTLMLQEALAPSTGLDLSLERLEEIEDSQLLGPRDMRAIAAKVTIKTSAGACVLILALPQSLLGPVSRKLARGASPSSTKPDPIWTRQMQFGVTQARIAMTAILDEFEMTLGGVASLAVGQVLDISTDGRASIRVECAERGVFHCKLGEQGGRYALEIEDIIVRETDSSPFASTP